MVARCSCLQMRRSSTYGLMIHYRKSTRDKIKKDYINKYVIINVFKREHKKNLG